VGEAAGQEPPCSHGVHGALWDLGPIDRDSASSEDVVPEPSRSLWGAGDRECVRGARKELDVQGDIQINCEYQPVPPTRPRGGEGDAKAVRATLRAESAIAMAQQAQPIAKVGVTGDR
jgi:hypothetical protein